MARLDIQEQTSTHCAAFVKMSAERTLAANITNGELGAEAAAVSNGDEQPLPACVVNGCFANETTSANSSWVTDPS